MTEVKKIPLYMFFLYFNFIFYFYDVMLRYTKMFCVDIGPSRRAGASPLEMRGVVRDMVIRNTKANPHKCNRI